MSKRMLILSALAIVLLSGLGCALGDLWNGASSVTDSIREDGISVEIPTPYRATPWPTLTLRQVAPTPAVRATSAAQGNAFRLELTEQDLADVVDERDLSQDGLSVTNLTARITPSQVIATFDASHSSSGISGEMTVITVPHVVDGALYLEVVDFELGDSFTGFARLIANSMVQAALRTYSTGDGIAVPMDDLGEISSIELFDGRMVLTGTSR